MTKNMIQTIIENNTRVKITTIDGIERIYDTKDIKIHEKHLVADRMKMSFSNIDDIQGRVTLVGEDFQVTGFLLRCNEHCTTLDLEFDIIHVPEGLITTIY